MNSVSIIYHKPPAIAIIQISNKQGDTEWYLKLWFSLVGQMVKSLPAMLETQVWTLGQKDPLEKGMASHSGILAWRIPRTEEPGMLHTVHAVTESDTATKLTFALPWPRRIQIQEISEASVMLCFLTRVVNIRRSTLQWFFKILVLYTLICIISVRKKKNTSKQDN